MNRLNLYENCISIPFIYAYQVSAKTPEDYKCPMVNYSCGEVENVICTGLDCVKLVEALKVEFACESIQFELSDNPGRLGFANILFSFWLIHEFLTNFFCSL